MTSVPIAVLRALAGRRVIVAMPEGEATGRLMSETLGDRAVVVLLLPDGGDPTEPLVIDVTCISSVVPLD